MNCLKVEAQEKMIKTKTRKSEERVTFSKEVSQKNNFKMRYK